MVRTFPLLLLALAALAACGRGAPGDWRDAVRRPTANPVVLPMGPTLVIPPTADLPPPR